MRTSRGLVGLVLLAACVAGCDAPPTSPTVPLAAPLVARPETVTLAPVVCADIRWIVAPPDDVCAVFRP